MKNKIKWFFYTFIVYLYLPFPALCSFLCHKNIIKTIEKWRKLNFTQHKSISMREIFCHFFPFLYNLYFDIPIESAARGYLIHLQVFIPFSHLKLQKEFNIRFQRYPFQHFLSFNIILHLYPSIRFT